MKIIPLRNLATARDFVERHHRHSDRGVRHKFSIGVLHDGVLVGVAIVGRPEARALDDGLTVEVLRCCVSPGAPLGACSMLYAACWRAWKAMGGTRIVTYTLDSESGASLRGAGWVKEARLRGRNRGWNCPARPRKEKPIYAKGKKRWAMTAEACHA